MESGNAVLAADKRRLVLCRIDGGLELWSGWRWQFNGNEGWGVRKLDMMDGDGVWRLGWRLRSDRRREGGGLCSGWWRDGSENCKHTMLGNGGRCSLHGAFLHGGDARGHVGHLLRHVTKLLLHVSHHLGHGLHPWLVPALPPQTHPHLWSPTSLIPDW